MKRIKMSESSWWTSFEGLVSSVEAKHIFEAYVLETSSKAE
jgi:hypothetical protein